MIIIHYILHWLERGLQRCYTIAFRARFKKAARLYIHRSARVVGDGHIEIGNNFTALIGLRLEAVTSYNAISYNPKIVIKNNVTLNDYVHIGASNYVEIGNNVLVASKVFISDHVHGDYSGDSQSDPQAIPAQRPLTRNKSVVIEDNVWICENVSILPGVRIGYGSIIGAHSVVSRDIPAMSIAVGSPAAVVKKFNSATKKWDRFHG